MIYLRQSTAGQEVPLGYFLDSTDGNSEETGLTIANTDIKLWKFGATALANKNSGGATHISNGIYYAVLDATDTNTLGSLVIFCHVSGALAVKVTAVVLAANVYDALVAASDNLQVHAAEITAGLITATALADNAITAAKIASDAITAAKIATGAIDADAIAADAITATKIADDAITAAKLATGAISSDAFALNAITGSAIAADAIGSSELAASAVTEIATAVNAEVVDALTVDVIADSVATDGSRPTIAQALLMILRFLTEKSVSGTTVTVKKEDGSTSSMTFTLDNGTNPTSITRAS